jgi:secreted trypsin-like serine protease
LKQYILTSTLFSEVVSSVKRKVDVEVVSNEACQRAFPSKNITTTQICAGGEEGKDSCNGDSGGPLMRDHVIDRLHFWYLVGVVSYGSRNCGTKDMPGVYTRVSEYIAWIESNLEV